MSGAQGGLRLHAYRLALLAFLLATAGVRAQSEAVSLDGGAVTASSIELEITTHLGDRHRFAEGDRLAFYVSSNRDAHLVLLYQDATGQLIQLLPNRLAPDSRIEAGEFISIPGPDAPFEFKISPPFGREQVWAFSASEALPELPGTELDNGLRRIDTDLGTARQRLRDFHANPGRRYGEASLTLTTMPALH